MGRNRADQGGDHAAVDLGQLQIMQRLAMLAQMAVGLGVTARPQTAPLDGEIGLQAGCTVSIARSRFSNFWPAGSLPRRTCACISTAVLRASAGESAIALPSVTRRFRRPSLNW